MDLTPSQAGIKQPQISSPLPKVLLQPHKTILSTQPEKPGKGKYQAALTAKGTWSWANTSGISPSLPIHTNLSGTAG